MSNQSKKEYDGFEWTFGDSVMLSLWYVLLGSLIYFFGWIIGISVYFLFNNFVSKMLNMLFGLEMMTGPDLVFAKDNPETNLTNIIAFNKFEKIDIKTIRDLIIKRSTKFQRMRSRGVKMIGRYMYYDMGADYVIKNQEKYFVACSDVHNEE